MHSIWFVIKKFAFSSAVLVLAACGVLTGVSGVAFADATNPPCVAPPDSSYGSGVHHPVGADAVAFTYQCSGPYAGEWTSAYYAYNPATRTESPLYSPDYAYDCDTQTWTMTTWTYSPVQQSYSESRVVPNTSPNLPTGCPPPTPPSAPNSSSMVSSTGTGSTNGSGTTSTATSTNTTDTALTMANGVTSLATSGNATVAGNTTAGSATTGDALTLTTIANLLQSTTNVLGPNTVLFSANINGDVNGDILLDPSTILSTGTDSTNNASNDLAITTLDTNSTDAAIVNNIDTAARSGDASVSGNTTAGNATSGNAVAIVNLLNFLNSTVAAGQSFIGTININGDLNGDILLPPDVINQLLASTGSGSQNTVGTNLTTNATATNTTSQSINNNILASAASGDASVTDNTTAGDALTGSAGTNITLLNLTGSNTVGKNDLLVFVNVLGQWVGMIVNAPAGTSAAELGGGITNSGTGSANAVNGVATDNSSTSNTTDQSITNTVQITAQSGDANVYHNTTAGNAITGNAYAAVNILNMADSNLSLSDWFGVLFINVFGIWNGSFGINTAAGDPLTNNPTYNPVQAATQHQMVTVAHQFARFVPRSATTSSKSSTSPIHFASAILGTATQPTRVLYTASAPTPDNDAHATYWVPLLGLGVAALLFVAGERDRLLRK